MGRSDTVLGGSKMWLVIPSESGEPTIIEVSKDRFVVGRDENADLRLDDPKVSGEHAVISIVPGKRPELRDLDSTNGTFVNGTPVKKPPGFASDHGPATIPLAGNEWIRFGDTLLLTSLIDPRIARFRDQSP